MPTAAELQQIIQDLRGRITQLEGEAGLAQSIVNGITKEGKAKLDAPTKYGGEKEGLAGFLTQVKAYLQYYPDKFRDEAAKVTFVASRLEGKALRWFEPTMKDRLDNQDEDDREDFTTKVFGQYAEFEKEILKVFGDTDEKLHAQERLARLRQTKSASAYATIFRQDSLRAEINDEGLMQLFYDGLKEEVKDELYKVDRPDNLDGYIAMAIRIDDRQYARKQQRQGKDRQFKPQANDKKKRSARYAVHGTHAGPMDTSAVQKGPSPTRRDRSDITCYGCGKKGHIKSECRSSKKSGWKPAPRQETATIDKHTRVVECSMVNSEAWYDDDFGPEHDPVLPQDEMSIPDTEDAEKYTQSAERQDRGGPPSGESSGSGANSAPKDENPARDVTHKAHHEVTGERLSTALTPAEYLHQRAERTARTGRADDTSSEPSDDTSGDLMGPPPPTNYAEFPEDIAQLLRSEDQLIEENLQLKAVNNQLREEVAELREHITRDAQEAYEKFEGLQEQVSQLRRALEQERLAREGPTQPYGEPGEVRDPAAEYANLWRGYRMGEAPPPTWTQYWQAKAYTSIGYYNDDMVWKQEQCIEEGDAARLHPSRGDHVQIPWFQCVKHTCQYHFKEKFDHDHWPIKQINEDGTTKPIRWTYNQGRDASDLLWHIERMDDGSLSIQPRAAWPERCIGQLYGKCRDSDCLWHLQDKALDFHVRKQAEEDSGDTTNEGDAFQDRHPELGKDSGPASGPEQL
jgi:hypothetical protein